MEIKFVMQSVISIISVMDFYSTGIATEERNIAN